MSKIWQLLPGDRVVHFQEINGRRPMGTIKEVDPSAAFFPYWVRWDPPWHRGVLPEGAFQTSCFDFAEMELRGMRPEMTAERHAKLDEFVVARMKAYKAGTVKVEGRTNG